jgi:hypothetical protein
MIGDPMKKCSACFIDKPVTEFYVANHVPSGRQSMCIPCYKAYYKNWREQRKESKPIDFPQSKTCQDCGQNKPVSQFGKRSVSKDKLMYVCKPCWRLQTRQALKKHYAKKAAVSGR